MKKFGKMGQINLSFGMIFSIILIIIFISFAFYAIMKFLDIQNSAQIGKFISDLQGDIDKMWKGSEGSQNYEYFIPSKIEYVCFTDYLSQKRGSKGNIFEEMDQAFYAEENLFFYPIGSAQGQDSAKIKNINLESITSVENPYCIPNSKGKLKLTIQKNFGEPLAMIER